MAYVEWESIESHLALSRGSRLACVGKIPISKSGSLQMIALGSPRSSLRGAVDYLHEVGRRLLLRCRVTKRCAVQDLRMSWKFAHFYDAQGIRVGCPLVLEQCSDMHQPFMRHCTST